jgi:hypothetical protein
LTLPSRKQQIEAVAKFLDSERNEGRSLEEIAADVVDGYHEALLKDLKKPATPLRTGMLIKSPLDAKVRRIAWISGGEAWIVTETSSYGWLGLLSDSTWEFCEEFRPKRRVEVDGKGKMVEMSDEDITEAWSNPDWKVGDRLSQHQREFKFQVIAVAPQCVLMQQDNGTLQADSSKCLEMYYKREVEW